MALARSSTLRRCALLSAPLLAALAGCGANSSMVARFDPPPSGSGTTSDSMGQSTAAQADKQAATSPAAPLASTRTGPITADWAAQMEVRRSAAGPAPTTRVASASSTAAEPFDRASLVFSAGTDQNTPAETVDGLSRISFATEGADFDPRISRDGTTLVFASTQHRPTADIYIKKIGSRAVTQLTNDPSNDVMPAISPDGRRIAFASDRAGVWQLYIMSAAGGRAVQVSPDGACDLAPTWSPDGKRLAFCRLGQVSGRWEMWVVDATNPASSEFIGFGMFPQWSPVAGTGDGGTDRIAFQRGKERGDRAFGLWTIDYKPGFVSAPTQIVPGNDGTAAINPNWSPDGRFIAYTALPTGQASGGGIWLVSVDGSATVNLTSGPASDMSPWWGRDGRVYFVSNRAGADNIWSVATERALAAMAAEQAPLAGTTDTPTGSEPTNPAATTAVPTNP